MPDKVNLDQMPYHLKLVNRYDECLSLRANDPEKYPRAVETFFFYALTTDRRETAMDKFEELMEENGLEEKYEIIEKVRSMKEDPYKKGRKLSRMKSKLSRQIADLMVEAGRYAMEEAGDFEFTGYEDNRPRGGD